MRNIPGMNNSSSRQLMIFNQMKAKLATIVDPRQKDKLNTIFKIELELDS